MLELTTSLTISSVAHVLTYSDCNYSNSLEQGWSCAQSWLLVSIGYIPWYSTTLFPGWAGLSERLIVNLTPDLTY